MNEKKYLVILNDPRDLGLSDEDIRQADIVDMRKLCLHFRKYDKAIDALSDYAETPCYKSELFSDLREATEWGYMKFAQMMVTI